MTYRNIGHFFIEGSMFNDEIMLRIFEDEDARSVPFIYQCTMIAVIEKTLRDVGCDIPQKEKKE